MKIFGTITILIIGKILVLESPTSGIRVKILHSFFLQVLRMRPQDLIAYSIPAYRQAGRIQQLAYRPADRIREQGAGTGTGKQIFLHFHLQSLP